jgi:predicted nucleic acid-binding protein
MRRAVLWDSSAVLALIDADDKDHRAAVEVAGRLAREARPSFMTNYLEVETHALLLRKLGRVIALEWLVRGGLPIVRAGPREERQAREMLARHHDKDWSLCDAISFALMDLRGVRTAFSFDRHFAQYGRAEVLGLSPS